MARARVDTLPLFIALSLVFAVYVPTLNDYFHGDDFLAFIDLTTVPPLQQIADVFTFADANVYWRPLGHVYYLAIYLTAGLDPFFFHLANLIAFLVTLALLYAFTLRIGLGRSVAIGAVLLMGLLPNHAVSVAWTTNGPRVLAVMFALLSLVLVQESIRTGKRRYDGFAFLAMTAAVLSDEVAASLTPLPFLYGLIAQRNLRLLSTDHIGRLVAYGALGLGITFLQFAVGTKGTPAREMISLSEVAFGWHIFREGWALVSKLVLPVTDGVALAKILPLQWVAGAVAAAAALVLLLSGSRRAIFLVAWVLLGLAPFTLWTAPIAPARYVYMAAVPFALLVSWAVVTLGGVVARWGAAGHRSRRLIVGFAGVVSAFGLLGAAVLGAGETIERNEAFAREAEPYRILAEQLPRELPAVPSHSRLLFYYGVWEGSVLWQDAVVQTVYRDRTLRTANINRRDTDLRPLPPLYNDVAVYYTERGFIAPARPLPFRGSTLLSR